ncbi:MAG: hypothetical protein MZV63_02850 [Marinilabiliales bacterium]|nr:hypothetical protein [Marinilabiliales bacterium]
MQEATKRACPAWCRRHGQSQDVAFRYDFIPGTHLSRSTRSAPSSPQFCLLILSRSFRKGYVSLGFGTYLSPFLEISLSNGRSKDRYHRTLIPGAYCSGGENDAGE